MPCQVYIVSLHYLKCPTCMLPSLTLYKYKTIQSPLHILLAKGNGLLCVCCPLGKRGEVSMSPRVGASGVDTLVGPLGRFVGANDHAIVVLFPIATF